MKRLNNLYIGKSRMLFQANGKLLPKDTLIGSVFKRTIYNNYRLPLLGIFGTYYPNLGLFDLDLKNPHHRIYITPVGVNNPLDYFRLINSKWSSFWEDQGTGYLFQITNFNEEPKLLINGTN